MFRHINYFTQYVFSEYVKFGQQTYTIILPVISYMVVVHFTKLQQIYIKKGHSGVIRVTTTVIIMLHRFISIRPKTVPIRPAVTRRESC